MSTTQMNAIVRLRRDNDYNYDLIKNTFVPFDGELILVDTASRGLKFKVGDGESTYEELSYIDFCDDQQIIIGYLYNNEFYEDNLFNNIITHESNKVYIDKTTNQAYYYDQQRYELITYASAQATDVQPGIMKLYQTTGQNTDGTMTQKSISDELSARYKTSVDNTKELLNFYI